MKTKEKIAQLKSLVIKEITPLINNDYLLLDLPYHSNLGDTLIWQGELDFLKSMPYKCKYSTWYGGNIVSVEKFLQPDNLILFHGGGNFGDTWEEPNKFRKNFLRMYPNNQTIILPQTVYYSDKRRLQEDAAFYADYPNVTICVRDKKSLEILQNFFPNNPSLLVPDMAFCMDMKRYNRVNKPNGTIFIRREDIELNHKIDYHEVPKDSIVSDWLFLNNSKEYLHQSEIIKWATRFDCRLGTDWKHRWIELYWHHVLRPLNVKTAINFVDQYEIIYTTRMHAAILCLLLGKTNITLFDNSYGKSSSFYHTWLQGVEGLKFIDSTSFM